MYGSHWLSILDFCVQVCSEKFQKLPLDERLPATQATLKLLTVLRSSRGANDDAQEAWQSSEERVYQGLIGLLKMVPCEFGLPILLRFDN